MGEVEIAIFFLDVSFSSGLYLDGWVIGGLERESKDAFIFLAFLSAPV